MMIVSRAIGIRCRMTRLMLGFLLVLSGCTRTLDGGVEASETRSLDPYSLVKVERGLHVVWSEGEPSVTIDSQAEVLKVIRTTVRNSELTVTIEPGVQVSSLQWTITLRGHGLNAVELHDSSSATLNEIARAPFLIEAHDGSQVDATGATELLQVRGSDGSTIRLESVAAKTVDVLLRDGSSARVQAVDSIGGVLEDGSVLKVRGTSNFEAVVRRDGSTVEASP